MSHHIKQFEHLKIKLEALKLATNNFSSESSIGKGGFGRVYKGKLAHAQGQKMVAMKRLDSRFGQGDVEFWKEIIILSAYQHENIVSLLGYCDESDERILVYEYETKGSLDRYLNNHMLTWVKRLMICIGVARGLVCLHSEDGPLQRVLHCDIKSSNILMDENWKAKISDFGLSEFGHANQQMSIVVTHPAGTPGYLDPLFLHTGYLSKESDVYSLGAMFCELLCGKVSMVGNDKKAYLLELVKESYEQNRIEEIIFDSIKDQINPTSLGMFATIAYQCLKEDRKERPLAIHIVRALETALHCQCPEAHKAGILNVKVLKTKNLERRSFFARSHPYVILKLTESSLPCAKKTKVKHNEVNPEWQEEFTFYVDNIDVQRLTIWVLDAASAKQHNIVGMASLLLANLTPEYKERDLYIFNVENRSSIMGNIVIEVAFKPFAHGQIRYTQTEYTSAIHKALAGTPKRGGVLVVIVHEARSLQGKNHMNPYVLMLFQGMSRKTKTMTNNKDPIWEEVFTFMSMQLPTNETLQLKVISSPMRFIHSEEPIAQIDISLVDVINNKRIIHTYSLQNGMSQLDVELQWRTYGDNKLTMKNSLI